MWWRKQVLACILAAGAVWTGSVIAQQSGGQPRVGDDRDAGLSEQRRTDQPMVGSARERSSGFEAQQSPRGAAYSPELRRASELIGKDIIDIHGQSVGTIEDLAIDSEHNLVAYAVVGRGGILGIGESLVPIPFKAVHVRGASLVMQTEEKLLQRIPEIKDTDTLSDLADPREARAIHGQFAIQPYWRLAQQFGADAPRPGARPGSRETRRFERDDIYGYESERQRGEMRPGRQGGPLDRDMRDADIWYEEEYESPAGSRDGRSRVEWESEDGRMEMRRQRDPAGQQEYRGRGAGYGYRDDQFRYQDDRYMEGGPQMRSEMDAPADRPGHIISASRMLGDDVEGTQAEPIGELEDLMVDMNSGAIGYAVVSDARESRDEYVVVPWNAFGIRRYEDETRLNLRVSRQRLGGAPSFRRDAWPDLASARWSQRVHSYYGVEPTWAHYGYVGDAAEVPEVRFDPQNVRTIQGTVQAMSRHGRMGTSPGIVMLRIRVSPGQEQQAGQTAATRPAQEQPGDRSEQAVEGQVITAYLAPVSFLREHELSFRRGDQVTLEGSEVELDGRPALLVSRVTKEGRSVELRSRQGEPLWDRGGAGQDQFRPRQ